MKCLFCSNEISDTQWLGMTNVCSCVGCDAKFYYINDNGIENEMIIWQFFFYHKNKEFCCEWSKDMDNTTISTSDGKNIATFSGSSALTPSNIQKRISTILVWS